MLVAVISLFTLAACADDAANPAAPSAVALSGTPSAAVVAGVNTIISKGDPTKCISVRGGKAVQGAVTELAVCTGAATQQFAMQSNGEIRLANTTLCLDAFNATGKDGDVVGLWGCQGSTNQRWSYNTTSGTITGINGKCIDINGGGFAAGTSMIIWSCHGGKNQAWTFHSTTTTTPPADTTTPTPPIPPPSGPLTVFPGAVGYGVTTPAGRGGAVIRVTNLNDSGVGSLRAALQASGARTIIFDVGGTITLSTKIAVSQPFLTLAGQTAPAPGIAIRGAGLSIRTHDVLVQHIRVRPGDGPGDDPTNRDGIEILGPNGYNIVIDHVSISWGMDENFSTWYDGAKDVTLSNSIVSEALNAVEPAQGVLVGDWTKRFAVIGTLMAHNSQRNPYFKGGTTGIAANNVVYNWSGSVATYYGDPEGSGPTQAAWVGNVGIRGPDANTAAMMRVYSNAKPGTLIYVADNSDIRVNGGLAPANPWSLVQNDASSSVMASSPPVWPDGFTAMPNGEVYESVLANAGAWPANRDAVDQRVVADVRNRTGRIITSQTQVGGWPNLGTPRRAPALPANPNGDDDGDGYTNLEEWLHSLARAVEGR